jgi:hypothetical protein
MIRNIETVEITPGEQRAASERYRQTIDQVAPLSPELEGFWPFRTIRHFLASCALLMALATLALPWYHVQEVGADWETSGMRVRFESSYDPGYLWFYHAGPGLAVLVFYAPVMLLGLWAGRSENVKIRWIGLFTPVALFLAAGTLLMTIKADRDNAALMRAMTEFGNTTVVDVSFGAYLTLLAAIAGLVAWIGWKIKQYTEA